MNEGDTYGGVVSSPPYADITNVGERRDPQKAIDAEARYRVSHPELERIRPKPIEPYGITSGNLGAMKACGFEAAVSSPPYLPKNDRRVRWGATVGKTLQDQDEARGYKRDDSFRGAYSLDNKNLGNPTGADQTSFWQAARLIVEQVYQVLTPGAVSIWVTKDFVRNKKRVLFSEQWAQLCEAVGFQLIEWHQASLIIDNGTQLGMFGDDIDLIKERKSFFRRLAEKKGSPRIDHEDILCLRKS
jgi:hypothetical protein